MHHKLALLVALLSFSACSDLPDSVPAPPPAGAGGGGGSSGAKAAGASGGSAGKGSAGHKADTDAGEADAG